MQILEFVENIYNDWIEKQQEVRSKDYEHLKDKFSASSSGSCYKKNIFKVLGADSLSFKPRANRILRAGTIQHEDLEKAVNLFIEDLDRGLVKYKDIDVEDIEIFQEEEIVIEKYNLAGHLDLAIFNKRKQHLYIIDYKTASTRNWSFLFGRKYKGIKTRFTYEMQLSTYAMGLVDKLEKRGMTVKTVDLYLLYIKKDESYWRTIQVEPNFINMSKEYWQEQNDLFNLVMASKNDKIEALNEIMPKDEMVGVPFEKWECHSGDKFWQCQFLHLCKGNENG
jgi:hypothetical protein